MGWCRRQENKWAIRNSSAQGKHNRHCEETEDKAGLFIHSGLIMGAAEWMRHRCRYLRQGQTAVDHESSLLCSKML